jgi:ribosomal-protein-alanine N-acetyltransferase
MTPTITTERLSLRHLTRATQDQIRWLNDPEVVRYSEQRHQHHTQFSQLAYVNAFKEGSHIWAIHRVSNKRHIGNITATYDAPNGVADVGIMIGEATEWGQGYGAEAWNEVCKWLLNEGGVRKLEAGCMRSNAAMMKIIRGSHFRQEGERVNHFVIGGGTQSAVLYGRFK